jgi:SAM-dependent methyltransferase
VISSRFGVDRVRHAIKAAAWKRAGRVPGAAGYNSARWLAIAHAVSRTAGARYGWDDPGMDERVVEYAWLFERVAALASKDTRVLDAGSVINYPLILEAWKREEFPAVSIVTLEYEGHATVSSTVRYEFADLRELPYRDEWFSLVFSVSTLEHVGLDNTIYGAAAERASDPGAEAARALQELHRVTKRGGTLLVSVPFGARSNRGWFRIFDAGDLDRLTRQSGWTNVHARYFRATREGWRECAAEDARTAGYNEPANRPMGQRTAPLWVGAAEAVALVEMTRV